MQKQSILSTPTKGSHDTEPQCAISPSIHWSQRELLDGHTSPWLWSLTSKTSRPLDLPYITYSQPKLSSFNCCFQVADILGFHVSFQADVFHFVFKLVQIFLNLRSKSWQRSFPSPSPCGYTAAFNPNQRLLNTAQKYTQPPLILRFYKWERNTTPVHLKPLIRKKPGREQKHHWNNESLSVTIRTAVGQSTRSNMAWHGTTRLGTTRLGTHPQQQRGSLPLSLPRSAGHARRPLPWQRDARSGPHHQPHRGGRARRSGQVGRSVGQSVHPERGPALPPPAALRSPLPPQQLSAGVSPLGPRPLHAVVAAGGRGAAGGGRHGGGGAVRAAEQLWWRLRGGGARQAWVGGGRRAGAAAGVCPLRALAGLPL